MLANYERLLGRVGHECLTSSDPAQVGECSRAISRTW